MTNDTADTEGFGRIYARHYPAVYRTVRAVVGEDDAEDVAQDAFVRAYRSFHRYDPARPIGAWLHRIAMNGAISLLRRRRLRRLVGLDSIREPATDHTEASIAAVTVGAALAALPVDQRAVVVLRYHHDYSYRDIAYVLSVPEGTVGSRLTLALRRLRKVLGEETSPLARMSSEERS